MSSQSSSDRDEDDGEDGERRREREGVGADEAGLDAADAPPSRARAVRDAVDRAGDERPLDPAVERQREPDGRPVEERVVELVEVELVLERRCATAAAAPAAVRGAVEQPGDAIPARPSATASSARSASCVPVGSTSGSATGSSQSRDGSRAPANWIQPPNDRRARRAPRRADHRQRPLEPLVRRMEVLAHERARLAARRRGRAAGTCRGR